MMVNMYSYKEGTLRLFTLDHVIAPQRALTLFVFVFRHST